MFNSAQNIYKNFVPTQQCLWVKQAAKSIAKPVVFLSLRQTFFCITPTSNAGTLHLLYPLQAGPSTFWLFLCSASPWCNWQWRSTKTVHLLTGVRGCDPQGFARTAELRCLSLGLTPEASLMVWAHICSSKLSVSRHNSLLCFPPVITIHKRNKVA